MVKSSLNLSNLREYLLLKSDEKFKLFSQNLIPNEKILGVRTPILREISKKINLDLDDFSCFEPKFHEEFIIKAFCIMNIKDEDLKFSLASNFLKTMQNWAVCDQFSSIKFNKNKYKNSLLKQAFSSNLEFEKRFYYVFFMKNFVKKENLDEFFKNCLNEKSDKYYIKMAMSWALAEICVNFSDEVLKFLELKKLDKFTQNKTISKIRDSFRISAYLKDKFIKFKV